MKILVVDDDPHLRDLLSITLQRSGFDVLSASDGQIALTHAARERPDLIVLDVGLPEIDGFEVCRRLRTRSEVPVLFLTARDEEIDRVVGLELGADDYVTKPFSPRELVARVRAILKRGQGATTARVMRHGMLELDPQAHDCRLNGTAVALTSTEMRILAALMQDPGRTLSRQRIVDIVWGPASQVSDRTLDSHVRNLRQKLAAAGGAEALETVHGVGIRMGACTP
ncbi:response regulator transcription factor [Stappia indica]|uniref:Response regulator n=1 Tax=Stappia indica TaxID=538381 RepID=A0A857CB03_9HYPH|nr:response regulator transcription factor [Stappia indica]QGZ36196.1 response regulator [Stappia indica]